MAKKAMYVKISNVNGEYRTQFLLGGAYKGQTHNLGNAVCGEFERQTSITLAPNTEKVFRMELTAQRKKAAK